MKPLFLIPCLLLLFTIGFSQDSVWKETKIDENLSINMPGEVVIIDTLDQKGFRSIDGHTIYIVYLVLDTKLPVDNPETLNEFLDGMVEGFAKKMVAGGLKTSKPKSIRIDSIEGRYLHCYTDNPDVVIKEWYTHMFLVNGIAYSIAAVYTDDRTTQDKKDFTQFIQSINFTAPTIAEKKFASKVESTGYKIGELIGSVIIPLAIVGLILYFILRKKKPKSKF